MDADAIAICIVLSVFGLMVLTLTIGGVLIVRDTIRRRGNWGINLRPVHCPECGEPAPTVRRPKNWRQALWGGCTCTECGLEYDKWGRPVGEPSADRADS